MDTTYQFTQNMKTLVVEHVSNLGSLYCREDFRIPIKKYRDAKKRNGSDTVFKKSALEKLCAEYDIDVDELLEKPDEELNAVPTRVELQEQLQDKFYAMVGEVYENYRRFPSPSDYMKRIIKNLAPEYSDDTVRTAILKKYVKGAGFDCRKYRIQAVEEWALGKMTNAEKKDYKKKASADKIDVIISKLDDSIFSKDHLETDISPVEELEILTKYVLSLGERELVDEKGKKTELSKIEISEEAEAKLRSYCAAMGDAEAGNEDAMELLSRLKDIYTGTSFVADDDFNALAENLNTELTLLLKKLKYINNRGRKSPVYQLAEDNIRDRGRAKLRRWEIVKVCDELASGKYKEGGATRRQLYQFAIMFGMSVCVREDDQFDEETDIEKNLFEDYYHDNLMRYLSEDYMDPKSANKYEKEPTGEGINYKNYVEVIYLYYLYRTDLELTPGERIDRVESQIAECKRLARNKKIESKQDVKEKRYTKDYRTDFEKLVAYDEEDMLKFVVSKYHIDLSGNSDIAVSSDEVAAFENLDLTMTELEEAFAPSQDYEDVEDIYNQLENAVREKDMMFPWGLAGKLKERYPEDESFIRLIDVLNKRLAEETKWVSSLEAVIRQKGELDRKITRTTLIVASLSHYITLLEDAENISSFVDIYEDFVENLNENLKGCRYQLFSEKNIMDVYVLLSLFDYVIDEWR